MALAIRTGQTRLNRRPLHWPAAEIAFCILAPSVDCMDGGYSSLKFALYRIDVEEHLLVCGVKERRGKEGSWLYLKIFDGRHLEERDKQI